MSRTYRKTGYGKKPTKKPQRKREAASKIGDRTSTGSNFFKSVDLMKKTDKEDLHSRMEALTFVYYNDGEDNIVGDY